MNRKRIMNSSAHTLGIQPLHAGIAIRHADHISVVNRAALRRGRKRRDNAFDSQQLIVLGRVRAAKPIPVVEVFEFYIEHRGLHRVEPTIKPDFFVMILSHRAPVAHQPQAIGQRGIVRGNSAAVAVGTEVLAGIKTESGGGAQ